MKIMGKGTSNSLIKLDGKAIEKLIEVISQGIGTLYKPTAIRREAKARAFEIEVLEKAKAKATAESKFIELETYNVIEQKFLHQQIKKQNNIDQIVNVAIEQINQQEDVSSNKVDPDWTTRFFNIAEDISNDEMQKLWGRILSGEVKQPGSFSLRTMEVLKNLTKEEAEIFTKFAQLKISAFNNQVIPYTDKNFLESQFKISYKQILLMSELGLIIATSDLALLSTGDGILRNNLLVYGDIGIYISKADTVDTSVKIISFTKTGSELSNLITIETDSKYLDYICRSFNTPTSKIQLGKLAILNGETIIQNAFTYEPKK